jgi:hypothetical protein
MSVKFEGNRFVPIFQLFSIFSYPKTKRYLKNIAPNKVAALQVFSIGEIDWNSLATRP